jgi:hypothetical protein
MLLQSPKHVLGLPERWIEETGCQAHGVEELGFQACEKLSPGERISGN